MANALLVSESTLADNHQPTVPDAAHEDLHRTTQPDGNVLLSRADQDEPDPALDSFLTFLANDIEQNPQRLKAVTPELVSRIQELVGDIDIDLDAPLDDADE